MKEKASQKQKDLVSTWKLLISFNLLIVLDTSSTLKHITKRRMGRLVWLYQIFDLLLLQFLCFQLAPSFSLLPTSSQLCHGDQKIALLQLKNSFSIVSSASESDYCYTFHTYESWKEDADCCLWVGVTCDEMTGHVIGLDLSNSCFEGRIYQNSTLFLLNHLQSLSLASNKLSGAIPDAFGNLPNLTTLDLFINRFSGQIPSSIFNLTQLSTLRMSNNRLVGPIPNQVNELSVLENIYLSSNSLNGTIPSWMFSLPSLRKLGLEDNQLTGQIPDFQAKSLEFIDFSNNELQGTIPNSMFELVNVSNINLSSNKLSGTFELDMFSKLPKLYELDLSYSGLSLIPNSQVNSTWPQLFSLSLSSCNITKFPIFLSNQTSLGLLDLSHNFLRTVNLLVPQYLDLRSNLIEGSLPFLPNGTSYFFISDNKLTGEIHSSICYLSGLQFLDLSNNRLSGKVPACLGNFSFYLTVLNLGMNSFHGPMPGNFSTRNQLRSLDLNGNLFEGPLPQSLIHCESLEILDLGNNEISDGFPQWLESLPNLQVLILRANRFHGPIGSPMSESPFQRLRIMDLSYNAFSGLLPTEYLVKLNAMRNASEQNIALKYMGVTYYRDSVMVTMKGLEIVLTRILTIFTTIDLSSNNFERQIPDTIGDFQSLKVLNLSHNVLSGHIPSSLGNMSALESMDLSSNKLVGEIPLQLTALDSLAVLNLSQNLLEGPIPQGRHFDTFNNDSFIGNSKLCGPPLSKTCGDEGAPQSPASTFHEEDGSTGGFNWKIATILGYGCGLILGISTAYIVFSTGKPWWLVKRVEGEWQYKVVRLSRRLKCRKTR